MKLQTSYNLLVLIVVASSLATGDSVPGAAGGPSGRSGGYPQRSPHISRLRETNEMDMYPTQEVVEQTQTPPLEPVTIDSGFVIYEGRYIPTPYTIGSERGTVHISGLKVLQGHPGQLNREAIQIERHLRECGLLIYSRNDPIAFVSAYQAISVLEILLGDEPDDVRVQKLAQTDTPWITSEQWAMLIKSFNGPTELYERVQALRRLQANLAEEDTDYELHWLVLSGMTFSGFFLAVWALGTLISCRPPKLQGSQATALLKISCRQVVSLVVLIAVLNIYDLACTLFAYNTGGLWELNPFASSIIHQNDVFVVFKLSLTIGAAILLLVARRHKLAQIGSWWVGVLYTVLILRWTIFNSMFL